MSCIVHVLQETFFYQLVQYLSFEQTLINFLFSKIPFQGEKLKNRLYVRMEATYASKMLVKDLRGITSKEDSNH
jgi:hypothetical protein